MNPRKDPQVSPCAGPRMHRSNACLSPSRHSAPGNPGCPADSGLVSACHVFRLRHTFAYPDKGLNPCPSLLSACTASAYDGIRPVLDAIAAKFKGQPCAAHLGPDGAGHFVKTVHNGIEYADMQMIAEAYGLMRYGMGQSPAAIGASFTGWNTGPLQSYLIEITGQILVAIDRKSGLPAVDIIVDSAGQKGTGRWTVIEALTLGQSASTIEAAVGARAWSSERATRKAGQTILGLTRGAVQLSSADLEQALLATRIIGYAQGFRLLASASESYTWALDMAQIAEVWRAGCIIRSALLDDIATAFRSALPEGQLIFAPAFTTLLKTSLPALRRVVAAAISAAQPVPVMSAALSFIDSIGQARGTTDLTQAQRDFFGQHGFERVDDGTKGQHGPWWD